MLRYWCKNASLMNAHHSTFCEKKMDVSRSQIGIQMLTPFYRFYLIKTLIVLTKDFSMRLSLLFHNWMKYFDSPRLKIVVTPKFPFEKVESLVRAFFGMKSRETEYTWSIMQTKPLLTGCHVFQQRYSAFRSPNHFPNKEILYSLNDFYFVQTTLMLYWVWNLTRFADWFQIL